MQIDIFLIYLQRKNKTLIINFIKANKIMAKGGGSQGQQAQGMRAQAEPNVA